MLIRSLFRSVAALGAALMALAAAPATLAAGPAVRDPDALTRFVEQRAASTDFSKLELFGEQAREQGFGRHEDRRPGRIDV